MNAASMSRWAITAYLRVYRQHRREKNLVSKGLIEKKSMQRLMSVQIIQKLIMLDTDSISSKMHCYFVCLSVLFSELELLIFSGSYTIYNSCSDDWKLIGNLIEM